MGKASLPARPTKKSSVEVQELAFFYEQSNPPMTSSPRRTTKRMAPQKKAAAAARTTIAVQGARVHNLKNISVEILATLDGCDRPVRPGKPSLAFDTIYAEGQRRYMESLSSCEALHCAGHEARCRLRVRPVAQIY